MILRFIYIEYDYMIVYLRYKYIFLLLREHFFQCRSVDGCLTCGCEQEMEQTTELQREPEAA